jgi:hypothetical protein
MTVALSDIATQVGREALYHVGSTCSLHVKGEMPARDMNGFYSLQNNLMSAARLVAEETVRGLTGSQTEVDGEIPGTMAHSWIDRPNEWSRQT